MISKVEGFTVEQSKFDQICEQSGFDIRQILNTMQFHVKHSQHGAKD